MGLMQKSTGRAEGRYFDLVAREGGNEGTSPQILSPSLYATDLRKLSCRKSALAVAKQLLGPSASFSGDQAILKPRRSGGPTPWHQDEAFRDPGFDYNELSIWIALTDTTSENGPMGYIPGSHLLGVLPHRLYENSRDANTIECYQGFDSGSAVVCPIPAGAMIVHHCRTVHGASRNLSDSERFAHVFSYLTPPVKRRDLREFPWLEDLRKASRQNRNSMLLRGGEFSELVRILRSDRYADRHFISGFMRRRFKQLARLLKVSKD